MVLERKEEADAVIGLGDVIVEAKELEAANLEENREEVDIVVAIKCLSLSIFIFIFCKFKEI